MTQDPDKDMSKEIAQGIIDDITERLMQPEAYEGTDSQFLLVTNGEERQVFNLSCNSIFLINAISGLIDTLGDKNPELLPLLMDKIAEDITEKRSAH